MCVMNDRNLTLLTDFYELTMGNGYLENGLAARQGSLTKNGLISAEDLSVG